VSRTERSARAQNDPKLPVAKVEKEERPALAADTTPGSEQPRGRRGRRGGRDRGPRNEARETAGEEQVSTQAAPAAQVEERRPVEPTVQLDMLPETVAAAPQAEERQPAVQAETPVLTSEPVPQVAAAIEVEAAPAAAEAEEVVAAEESVAPVEEAIESAKPEKKPRPPRRRKAESAPAAIVVADIADSGLEMVETKSDLVQPVVAPEVALPKRTPKQAAWQKKADAQAAEEPLVMVETGK
jgi:ribonuclease E